MHFDAVRSQLLGDIHLCHNGVASTSVGGAVVFERQRDYIEWMVYKALRK